MLTLTETARYLKVSEKTILRMIAEDAIPCVKIGGQWRFMQSALDSWLLSKMRGKGSYFHPSSGKGQVDENAKK